MTQALRLLLLLACLTGQLLSAFGSPLILSAPIPGGQKYPVQGCCCSANAGGCCQNGCSCSTDKQQESVATDSNPDVMNPETIPTEVAWMNPVSANRCKGTQLIHQLGTDLFIQYFGLQDPNTSITQHFNPYSEQALLVQLDQDSPPPKILNS